MAAGCSRSRRWDAPAASLARGTLLALLAFGCAAAVAAPRPTESELRTTLARAHALSGSALLWSRGGELTPQARALLDVLRAAEVYGLSPADYGAAPLADLARDAGSSTTASPLWAELDARLSAAALRFLMDLHYGRVDPRLAGFELERTGAEGDFARTLAQLAAAPDLRPVISSVEPPFDHYRLLEQILQRYRELAAQPLPLGALRPIARRSLRLGDAYSGAPALRQVLRTLGDLPGPPGGGESQPVLDEALVAALKRFQERHGLEPDGTLGKATLAALTTPLSHRVRQIELTLERWRWLPPFTTPPVIVNVPQFRLFAFRSTADVGAQILQQDVIVGRAYPRTQTPVFAADMRYVVFRPYWDVPADITRRELLAQIHSKPDFLASQHLEIVAGSDESAPPLPPTPANLAALEAGRLRLRQQPGPDNALGLIKFVMPNRYDVYLHSTPAHRLFEESRRDFSHGCIRVADPVALAVHVLGSPEWTAESVQAAMNGTETRWVKLATPVRVMILYGTVLALESGQVLFFQDIYGHDRRLERLLHLAPVP